MCTVPRVEETILQHTRFVDIVLFRFSEAARMSPVLLPACFRIASVLHVEQRFVVDVDVDDDDVVVVFFVFFYF